jgi:hypothetical protein
VIGQLAEAPESEQAGVTDGIKAFYGGTDQRLAAFGGETF